MHPSIIACDADAERRIGRWLTDYVLPLWHGAGFDAKSGFYFERLHFDATPAPAPHLRLMVQMRQIATYCRANVDGLHDGGQQQALECFARARRYYHRVDGHAGWAFAIDPATRSCDGRRDLYAHAFVLYAHAWAYAASGDPACLRSARQTLADICVVFDGPNGDSLARARNASGLIEQNPRMHLLEACLAMFEVSGDVLYLEYAQRLVNLALARMIDPLSGAIAEIYTAQWHPVAHAGAFRVEPGHQLEWAWLLLEFLRLWPEAPRAHIVRAAAMRLGNFGCKAFRQPKRAFCDAISSGGDILESSIRIWPQTEAIRLLKDYGDLWPLAHTKLLPPLANNFLSQFAPLHLKGGWIDHFDEEGRPKLNYMPASSLYHIYGAVRSILK